ncbi:cortactin-binding protein 2 isoform X1 [Pleurodeles waltl]|uniref:cortactin-binding protein 2 isoform X1 n=2 Tax=Pleurodeles waltl TaxID=8319 RepID=UPI00370976C2
MATDGASAAGEAALSPEPGEAAEKKKGFDVDSLSQSELRFLLSILEGELEARDLVIEALRARTREAFIQDRYGKFNLSDPFLALQRDYETGGEKQKRPICTNPISILEIVMAHCRKMQERMSLQLAAAERRQRKLEFEKTQLQNLEQEHKNVSTRLEEERAKNKHVVLMLVKECKQLSSKIIEESQKLEELMSKLEAEKQKCSELEEALTAEKLKSTQMEAQMEAQMEKQLSEFDTEREQLRAKLFREEAHTKDLTEEMEKMKMVVEHMQRENDCKLNSSRPPKTKELHFVSIGVGVDRPSLQSISCQTDIFRVDNQTEITKKSPLTVPAKPAAMAAGNTKMNVCTNSLIGKPGSDRHMSCNDSVIVSSTAHSAGPPHSRTEENGSGSSPDLAGSSSLYQNNPAFSTSPASPSYLSSSMHSLQSHCANTTLHSSLNPRVQAARFRFQANANDHDQNGNATPSASTREIPPRDNVAAKQLARNTVTQVLSRFTSPHGGVSLRPGLPHSMEVGTYPPVAGRMGHQSFGLKSPTVSRIDRGNPPPIPPKKPGLSQTPSPPHPQLKVIMDGSRSPHVAGRVENKSMSSHSSTSLQGIRGINEETLSKSSSPQLPPKPTIELSVASAGCVIPAMATSQVGAWPPKSPGLKQPACSESSLVISNTIACNSSINPVSASSCRPCDSDSLLVTASGWSPSLTPLLMSGGPVPLGGRSTLLHQAAAQGNVTLLSMLLNEEGTNINYSCEDGYSALYSAAENGHTECVRLLLTAGAQVDTADKNGFTALCSAAAQGHFRCMKLLIAYNSNINHAAERGQTPLYLASQNGNNKCIKLLLGLGADRGFITSGGRTPIHAAVDSGNPENLNLLLYYDVAGGGSINNDAEPDLGFCDSDYREDFSGSKAKPVVSASLINHADNEGWTPAHIAASKGFKDCLGILCNHHGLEIEKKDKCNRTVHDVATDDCKQLLENLNVLKVHLSISVEEKTHMFCGTDYSESENMICALSIRKQTTWEDFSEAVTRAIMNHFQEIVSNEWGSTEEQLCYNEAESSMGLTMNSISSVKLGNASWIPDQMLPNSPWDILRTCQAVTVRLLGPQDGCLHSVSYASMIPLQTLQNFLRLVEQYHNVIFHGPEESLQDYIAHQIALCIKHKHESLGFCCEVVKVQLDAEFSKEQLVELFISRECLIPVMVQPPAKRTIVILENLEKTPLLELLGDFLEPLENRGLASSCCFQKANGSSDAYYFHENCYLMGTIAKARLQGSDLLVQQHFRWVQLRWDGEPIHGLLKRFLRRKAIHKFKGKTPTSCDPVCKSIDWVSSVWHQLNACLSRLGTPEALIGPKHFLSCPIVPGNAQSIVNWMSKLWNAVIAPRVQEAIFSRASVKRLSPAGQGVGRKPPSQGQQAVVRAALSILLNKAVLHGCPLPRAELDQYTADFRGGSFPLSAVTNYKNKNRKMGGSEAWRKVSTSPRKKSSHLSPQSWNTLEGHEDGEIMKNVLKQASNKKTSPEKHKDWQNNQTRVLNLEQQSSHGSDDEVDLVHELQSMCFSKSEPDIRKIGSSEDCFSLFRDSQNDPVPSTTISNPQKDGFCPLSSSSNGTTNQLSASKMGWSDSRVKSLLPVPKNKVSHSSKSTKRSSSNTRQIELNNNSNDEIWHLHKSTQIDKPNK